MKTPRQRKPFNQTTFWFLLTLILITGIVAYFSYQIRELRDIIENQKPIIIHGINGIDGTNGLQGIQGIAGINAVSTDTILEHDTATTFIEQEEVQGPQGETGASGTNGIDGKSIELQYDSISGILEYKYEGDRFWSPVPTGSSDE